MPFILAPMKLSRNLPVGTKQMANIIRWLQVWCLTFPNASNTSDANFPCLATSGACATIASDALMNPFDGMHPGHVREPPY